MSEDKRLREFVRFLCDLTERMEKTEKKASFTKGLSEGLKERLASVEERLEKVEAHLPDYTKVHDVDEFYKDPAPGQPAPRVDTCVNCGKPTGHTLTTNEIDSGIKQYCSTACYQQYLDMKSNPAPTGEARLKGWQVDGRFRYLEKHGHAHEITPNDPADLAPEPPHPYESKEYKRLNDDYCHLLLDFKEMKKRAESAELRLKEAMEEAESWFKAVGDFIDDIDRLQFEAWLARFGQGEKEGK